MKVSLKISTAGFVEVFRFRKSLAAVCVASFGTLGFSTHRGLATLGQLLTLGVAYTMLTTLIVLPALIPARWRRVETSLVSERADTESISR